MYTGNTYNLYRYNGYCKKNQMIKSGWEIKDAYIWEWDNIFSGDANYSAYTVVDDIVELTDGPIEMLYDYQQQKYCIRTFGYTKGS